MWILFRSAKYVLTGCLKEPTSKGLVEVKQKWSTLSSDTVQLHLSGRCLSGSPNYPDRLVPSDKFVQNYTKLTCLEIVDPVAQSV